MCPYTQLCLSLAETSFVFTGRWTRQIEEGEKFCPKIMLKIGGVGRKIMMGLKWTFLQQKLGRLFEAIFKIFDR